MSTTEAELVALLAGEGQDSVSDSGRDSCQGQGRGEADRKDEDAQDDEEEKEEKAAVDEEEKRDGEEERVGRLYEMAMDEMRSSPKATHLVRKHSTSPSPDGWDWRQQTQTPDWQPSTPPPQSGMRARKRLVYNPPNTR